MGALQFVRLLQLGMTEGSSVLDVGAGSLRAGKLLIPFLGAGNYFALEPEQWLIEKVAERELGRDIFSIKRPSFVHNRDFDFSGLPLPEGGVDFCVAQSIFSHTSRAQMKKGLASISEVLGGVLLATYMPGGKDYEGDEWVYPHCVNYTTTTVREASAEAGLSLRETDWMHPSGQRWFVAAKGARRLENVVVSEDADPTVNQYRAAMEEQRARLERIERSLPYRLYRTLRGG